MKILYVADAVIGSSGSGQSVRVPESVMALSQLGHEVHLIARGDPASLALSGGTEEIRPVLLPLLGTFLTQIRYWRSVKRAISMLKPDIVYIRLEASMYGAVRASVDGSVPFFVEVNGDLIRELELQRSTQRLRWLCKITEQLAYRYARGIVVVGEGEKEAVIRRYGIEPDRFFLSPNGASEKLFRPDSPLPERFKMLLGDETFRWVYAGAVTVRYALEDVLKVQKVFEEKGAKIALWIVGDGDLLPELKAQALSLGLKRVSFLGWIPRADLPGVLSCADLGIFAGKPITPIGSPIKVAEYLACGLPVVFREGNPEGKSLSNEGAAHMISFDDPFRAAGQILDLINRKEELKSARIRARQVFLKQMTWTQRMKELTDDLKEHMEKGPSND